MGFPGILLTASLLAVIGLQLKSAEADYRVGVGIADCTGPAAGVNFMGYADLGQQGTGLHLRQFARAYIIDDGLKRFAFVSVDVGMIGYGMREEVIANLATTYGDTYSIQNLIISGTHTHGSPGGFMEHFMFDLTIFGFVKQTFDGLVSGITKAMVKAHEGMTEARIFLNSGELLDANINRSPASYLRNPEAERQQYDHDVDKTMTQLKFVSTTTEEIIGVINWFPIHPVSMNHSNLLISSDNVGYASVLLEKNLNKGAFPGKGDVVAGFASTNLGDVSPNINGPICVDTGEECDEVTSSCNGEALYCIASGPGEDMFESTKIIAERLYGKALELLTAEGAREITGAVDVIHQFIDMPSQEVTYPLGNGNEISGSGCSAAMGYSFAAGTIDGPGPLFTQGVTTGDFIWDFVRDLLAQPSDEDVACQAPKPILLATGKLTVPYDWQPSVVSTQLAVIGDVAIAAVPGEFTTMAGRRLKNIIRNTMVANGAPQTATVVIAGLSNHYTDYITTYEEYQLQRFEGATTVYGPHTLGIHMVQYEKLTRALLQNENIDEGPTPPTFDTGDMFSLVPGVILDMYDLTDKFGFCKTQPPEAVTPGATVTAVFVAGHPRNNLLHDESFLLVERLDLGGEWVIVATDAVWETRFTWRRTLLAASEVVIEWDVDENVVPGTHRIRHFGYAKSLFGAAVPYEGTTKNFEVVNEQLPHCSAICPLWQGTTLALSLLISKLLAL